MTMLELMFMLLLAQATATLAASREYIFVKQLSTWAEAQSYCRERFADLATVETEEDLAGVADVITNSGSTFAWIGLYDDVKSWRWSLDNTSVYTAEKDGFGDWIQFIRDNRKSNQHCLAVLDDKLHDYYCDKTLKSVCYDEPSNTYILATTAKTWKSAQSYCREEYTDLASMRNQQEMESIMSKTRSQGWCWIGSSRESWKWSDQSDSMLRKWDSDEPIGGEGPNCVFSNVNGWHDAQCESRIPFICSANTLQKKVVKIVLRSKGKLDLNDPKIKEAIVKQIEKDMRERGVDKSSLTWREQSTGKVFTLTSPHIDPRNPPKEEEILLNEEAYKHCVKEVYVP